MIRTSSRRVGTSGALMFAALLAVGPRTRAGAAPPIMTSLHVLPSPVINNSSLSGAAAIADNDLWAVGGIGSGGGANQTLAEHFDGASWSVVPTPSLSGLFEGAAAAAGSDVWAVGEQAQGSFFLPLIEHWNGASWSVVPSPRLPKNSNLRAVTAPASNDVWAVGTNAGSSDALVEHWDGASWSIVSSPAFTGVSVTRLSSDSPSDVWAVGGAATGGTVALHWNGATWSQIPTVRLRTGGIEAVAALSPTDIWAVGTGPGTPTGGFSAHPTAVIEQWNGTSWNVVPSPNPNPQGNNGLAAIAAALASDIWAFGFQLQGPFTEHWDGTSWSIVATPAGVRTISGAAALSDGTVIAVGQGTNNSGVILHN